MVFKLGWCESQLEPPLDPLVLHAPPGCAITSSLLHLLRQF